MVWRGVILLGDHGGC